MSCFLILISSIYLLPAQSGQEIRLPDLKAKVAALVARLSAPALEDREEAERQLLELGPQALDVLRESEELSSPEARLRLERVRRQLEIRLASRAIEGASVNVPAGVSVWQAVKEIENQTANRIVFETLEAEQLAKRVVVPGSALPKYFWPLLDRLAEACGLEVTSAPKESAVLLRLASPTFVDKIGASRNYVSYAGPLRCRVLQCLKSDRGSTPGDPQDLLVRLQLLWEPRIRPIVFYWVGGMFRGRDARGRELHAAAGEGTREVPALATQCGIEILARLELPAVDEVERLGGLEGRVVAVVAGEAIPVRFPLAQLCPQLQRIGDATVVLQNINATNTQTAISLRVVYGQAYTAFESHRAWFYQFRPWLALPGGKIVPPTAIEPQIQRENEVALVFRFPPISAENGGELIWEIPGAIAREEYTLRWESIPVNPADLTTP
ncbi:MAG: hypothetical protein NZ899_05810 [Thermoguttaceae bacterium]|nr:hypothetical protein [Thermoguttaceae bacterium]MDW8079456.1 hypothetical protein [Thermoguttaceae bacterium]